MANRKVRVVGAELSYFVRIRLRRKECDRARIPGAQRVDGNYKPCGVLHVRQKVDEAVTVIHWNFAGLMAALGFFVLLEGGATSNSPPSQID